MHKNTFQAPPPAVPKKTVTIVEGAKIVPLLPKKVEPPRQVFHGGLRSQTRYVISSGIQIWSLIFPLISSANFNPLRLPMDTSNYTWKKNGEDQPNGSRDDERRENGKWERRQEIIEVRFDDAECWNYLIVNAWNIICSSVPNITAQFSSRWIKNKNKWMNSFFQEEDLDMDDPARRGVVRVVLPQRDNE